MWQGSCFWLAQMLLQLMIGRQEVCCVCSRPRQVGCAGGVLYAAHCGDSRAVLCRQGRAVRLTEDHKPNLPPERQRIQAVGGRVEFSRCWRVIFEPQEGRSGSGLAVSRSFGDLDFKEPNRCESVTMTLLPPELIPCGFDWTGSLV